MAETRNLGGLADAIFAEIDRLQDPELTGDRLKEEITRAQSISGLARQVSQIASLQLSVSKMVYEARPEICRGYSCSKHASGELLVDVQLLKSLSTAADVDMRLFAEAI